MSDNDLLIIPTAPQTPYPLGRNLWHDPANKLWRALPKGIELLPDRDRLWFCNDVFDQIDNNCTTEAAIGLCRTSPQRTHFPDWPKYDLEQERVDFYYWSQQFDPWAGSPHEGSSTDAPFKGLRARNAIMGWKWLFGIEEVKQWIMYHGACSVGTNWHFSMWEPVNGYLIVDQNSSVVGGHAWRIVGYSMARKAFRMVNSWGRGWGEQGRAWVREADLAWLLNQQGEAVTAVI
jgi:hypothetical protein